MKIFKQIKLKVDSSEINEQSFYVCDDEKTIEIITKENDGKVRRKDDEVLDDETKKWVTMNGLVN